MTIPPSLKPGDEIRLICPSRWAEESLVEQAEAALKQRGYLPTRSKHLLARSGQLAGTDAQRAEDFLAAWHDPAVKAIWAMRGGYGAQRILDRIEKEIVGAKSAKWYIGFSDSTAIHGLLNAKGLASLHAAMWSTMPSTMPEHVQATFDVLEGKLSEIGWDSPVEGEEHFDSTQRPPLAPTVTRGRLVGGNLSVLQTMVGTSSFARQPDDILFIEDLDEMLYHLDRMLLHMRRSGSLDGLAGILIGGMSEMRDNTLAHGFSVENPFGQSAKEILSHHLGDLGIPIAFGFPAGHGEANHPLVLGAEVEMVLGGDGNRMLYVGA